jgi:ATP-binding cassette, subfamily B (MDR/TAP), member 1
MTIWAASQIFAGLSLNGERAETAVAATLVRRAVAANATLQALNAQLSEPTPVGRAVDDVHAAPDRCDAIWGPASGPLPVRDLHYIFIHGFRFNARLVRAGHLSTGDVMITAVLWGWLVVTSNVQIAVPRLVARSVGKVAKDTGHVHQARRTSPQDLAMRVRKLA